MSDDSPRPNLEYSPTDILNEILGNGYSPVDLEYLRSRPAYIASDGQAGYPLDEFLDLAKMSHTSLKRIQKYIAEIPEDDLSFTALVAGGEEVKAIYQRHLVIYLIQVGQERIKRIFDKDSAL